MQGEHSRQNWIVQRLVATRLGGCLLLERAEYLKNQDQITLRRGAPASRCRGRTPSAYEKCQDGPRVLQTVSTQLATTQKNSLSSEG
jgi:hypothetical protein